MPAGIADCEANQAAWNAAVARAVGGDAWQDGGLRWSWQPHDGHLMLSFPRVIDAGALARGLAVAAERNVRSVGAWVSRTVDAAPLRAAAFEEGWEPRWMAAPLADIAAPADPRVAIDEVMAEYDDAGQALMSLARDRRALAAHAAARVDGAFAGRAWFFVTGAHAGIYDMDVWPRFRRRGLGRALLHEVCAAAAVAGARTAVLNATEDGALLYASEGFVTVGTGVTWWLHR